MALDNYYTIYRHIAPNNKSYVGVTRQHFVEDRWQRGKGYSSCPLFNNAIQKYGWENFRHEILELKAPIQDINAREKYWIQFYKSNNREYGYNIEEGGHAHRTFSEQTRKKISEALSGRKKSEEHKQKLRASNLGKKPNALARFKMSQAHSKGVEQYTKDGKYITKFSSIKFAALTIQGDPSAITKCCKRKSKTHKGFIWRYEGEQL